jgi:predicted esterase
MPERAEHEGCEACDAHEGEASRSALAFRVSPAISAATCGASVVVLLPPAPGSDEQLLQAVREAGWAGKVITLMPPRAVYHREEVRGFTWYHAIHRDAIEPSSFGDSLWHVERFVLDLLQQENAPEHVILIGAEEGACVALASVPYLHDRIAAVVAINGALPEECWWAPDSATVQNFPVWMIRNREDSRCGDSSRWLSGRGARVEISDVVDSEPWRTLRNELGNWLRKNDLAELRGVRA